MLSLYVAGVHALVVTAASEVLGGAAHHRAGSASPSSDEGLLIAALIVGVVGLLAGLAALVAWRRKTSR